MRILKSTFFGTVWGFAASILLIFLGLACDFVSCSVAIISCSDYDSVTTPILENFGRICPLLTVIGMAVGLCYGLIKVKEESDSEQAAIRQDQAAAALQQQRYWAADIKKKAQNIEQVCGEYAQSFDAPMVSVTYKADAIMESIADELAVVAELQGKVNALNAEMKKEGEKAR